jgi:hypothetical protein
MATIQIVITQSAVSGAVNESRDDLVTGTAVFLTNSDNVGATSFLWEFINVPDTSAATISGSTTDTPWFTPDVVGSYLIQLTINDRIKGRVVAAVKTAEGMREIATGEANELGWQNTVNDNFETLRVRSVASTAEIEAARFSDVFTPGGGEGGGQFADLNTRISANDTHSRVYISCTDGTNSVGGMYDGQDALQNAIQANFNGATILLRRGEYHIDTALTIGKMMHIIGVEDEVVIVNKVPNVMLTYEPDAYGSSIRNVSIINFGAGIYDAVFNMADELLIKQCKIEGSITLSTGWRSRIEQCFIYPISRNCITIFNAVSTKISQCEIWATGEDLKMLDYRGYNCDVSDCIFLDSYGSQAIVDAPNSTGLKIRGCIIRCQPYKRDKQVVFLAGQRPEIDGLYMYTWGPGNISTSLLSVSEAPTFRGRNIRINLQENLIGDISPGVFGSNSPVAVVSSDAILDGFIMDGGITPRLTGDGWVLNEDYPLIQLTGIPNYGVVGTPTQLTKGRVKLCNATISAPYYSPEAGQMNVVLIGDEGQGSGVAKTPNGFFELENVNIDGYRNAKWAIADGDVKHMVSNIQYGSKIHGCSFTDGEQSGWNTIINCVDAYDVQITDNSFQLDGYRNSQNIILGFGIGTGVKGMMVNNNNIRFSDLEPAAGFSGAVTLLGATNCTICGNMIYNTFSVGSGIHLVNLFVGTTNCIITGNTIHTGDGGAANLPIADWSWAGPPGFPNPPPANLWSSIYSTMEPALGPLAVPPPPVGLVTFLGPTAYDLNVVD